MLPTILDIANILWILFTKKRDLRCLVFVINLASNLINLSSGIEKFGKVKIRKHNLTPGVLIHFRRESDQRVYTQKEEFHVAEYTNLSFSHAESPVFDQDTGTLYWVDVLYQNVHALDYDTFDHRVKHVDYGEVNVVIPVKNSRHLLIGCGSNVYIMNWNKTGDAAFKHIANLDQTQVYNVIFNEGKADAYGRLWAGTKGPQRGDQVAPNRAALFSIEWPCFAPKVQLSPVTVSNGLTWALNNSIFYYIDSVTNKIEAFDYDLFTGQISNARELVDLSDWGLHKVVPDGMTIDRDGFLWVALLKNGSVIRVDPDTRQLVQMYQLPVSRTTSVTWAGKALEDLVVTTSRRNLKEQALAAAPLSGTIFILRNLGTGGVGDHKFVYRGP